MTTHEVFDVDMAWRDLVIAGQQSQIDQLLDTIDRSLPSEWVRDTAAEQQPLMRGGPLSRSRCYTRHLQGRDVRLWLLRRSDYRLDGGVVESTDSVRYHEDIAESILDFRNRVLEPAVKTCDLVIGRNRLGPLSWVPTEVLERLWAFYDSSGFNWPPTGQTLKRWREFVVSAYQTHAAFDRNELSIWLRNKGWSDDDVELLIKRLYSEAALLSEYDELRQPV